jgi:DNA-binding LacI/PurR family transcriptional regulator
VAARALVTRRTRTLGVISFNTTLYGPASMLYGIEQAAKDLDYFVAVAALSALDRRSVLDAVERLRDQAVEGMIVIAPQTSAVSALSQVRSDIPLVAVGCGTHAALSSVAVDNEAGPSGPPPSCWTSATAPCTTWPGRAPGWDAQEREAGWRRTLIARGAPVPEPIYGGDWTARSGFELGRELVERVRGEERDPVTAVFCANDHTALGLLRAVQQAGLKVPEELSIIGFDDIPEAEYFGPPLTTIRQDFDEVGRRALATVIDLVDGAAAGVPARQLRHRRRLRHALRPGAGGPGQRRRRARHRGARVQARGDRADPAADGSRLPPDWALQDPEDYREVLRDAVPEAARGRRASTRRRSSASPPTSPRARCCRP